MTDKPPPLNLIERMAQRLAKQEATHDEPDSNGALISAPTADLPPRMTTPFVRAEPMAQPVNAEIRRAAPSVAAPIITAPIIVSPAVPAPTIAPQMPEARAPMHGGSPQV